MIYLNPEVFQIQTSSPISSCWKHCIFCLYLLPNTDKPIYSVKYITLINSHSTDDYQKILLTVWSYMYTKFVYIFFLHF